jgi:hypothetical protein
LPICFHVARLRLFLIHKGLDHTIVVCKVHRFSCVMMIVLLL